MVVNNRQSIVSNDGDSSIEFTGYDAGALSSKRFVVAFKKMNGIENINVHVSLCENQVRLLRNMLNSFLGDEK